MRPMIITRIHRRCIVKYFGSCKNLIIWVFSVLFTVFILDSYLFSSLLQKNKLDQGQIASENKEPQDQASPRNVSCGQSSICPYGQYSYFLKSGLGKDGQPTICFNGHVIFSPEKNNGKRGICLVRVNGRTLAVEDVRTVDTYENDMVLQRYLMLGVPKNDVVLLATVDEASLHLSGATKELIVSFGSSLINGLEFRDSFVMIGQRFLAPPAKAIEQLMKRKDGEIYASMSSIEGCVSIPMGTLVEMESKDSPGQVGANNDAQIEDKVKLGDYFINCGVSEKCPVDSFPISIYTGNKNVELPKVCFRDRYVITPELNDPGRGIAVVVVDSSSGAVVAVQRFDTYESADKSNQLVEFLKNIKSNEILIALAHDEAKTALSEPAKDSLTSFGSNFIGGIGFRDVWTFVGRPNINGFSPFEDIEPAGKDTWPYPITLKFCLDKNFKGQTEKLDLNLKKNILRRTFCKTYDGYEDFCSVQSVDEHPKTLPPTNKTFEGPAIYKIPIILVPGLSQVSTLKQLQALFTIPGLDLSYVVMMVDEKFEESRNMAALFNVTIRQLKSSTKYISLMHDAMDLAWNMFKNAKYAIFLEEEVLPTVDLLSYFGQCLDVLDGDETLAGATAFNENGFEGISKRPEVVYRGRTFPGSGFMLKKSFYLKHISRNVEECCNVRSWFGWKLPEDVEMLIPEMSRAIRRVYLGLTEHAEFIREYFNKPRVSNGGGQTKLSNMSNLSKSSYKALMEKLIRSASIIPNSNLKNCIQNPGLSLSSGTHVVYLEQPNDDEVFVSLCHCFNLLYSPEFKIRGSHDNTLRFSYHDAEVILVGEKSSYYKLKPDSNVPFGLKSNR